MEKDPSELLTIRNFGVRSLDELKEKLFEHGITYGVEGSPDDEVEGLVGSDDSSEEGEHSGSSEAQE